MKYYKVPDHIEALIFDIDGTLVDTMPTHYKSSRIACLRHGYDFPLDYFLKKAGRPTLTVFEEFVSDFDISYDGRTLGLEKEALVEQMIPEFKPMPVIAQTAIHYHGKLKMALGTGGTHDIASRTVEAAGLSPYFDVLVSADDVTNFKPHPETFLKAAEALGVEPSKCLVFEDAEPGLKAARDGGFEVLDIRTVVPEMIYETGELSIK